VFWGYNSVSGEQEFAARAGLYLLIEDVTVCDEVIPVILHGVVSPEVFAYVGYKNNK